MICLRLTGLLVGGGIVRGLLCGGLGGPGRGGGGGGIG